MMTENITEMPVKPKMVQTCFKEQKRNSHLKLKQKQNKPELVVSSLESLVESSEHC